MAQRGAGSAAPDRGEPAAAFGQVGVADGEDAPADAMESPGGDAARDAGGREPEREELPHLHEAVLPRGKPRDLPPDPRPQGWAVFMSIGAPGTAHPLSVAGLP